MDSFDWGERFEHWAKHLRGRRKSVVCVDVLNLMQKEYPLCMNRDDAPKKIAALLTQLIGDGRWRAQPKEEAKWVRGWRGLKMPNKLIYQSQDDKKDVVTWHPWLAKKGAANARGKHRDKLKLLNQHLICCELSNEDPFPGDILGQRERALRLFDDEKALDSMPDAGWKSVPINREELRCIKKPPPIQKAFCPEGNKPPLILENVETFHRFVEINKTQLIWSCVIWGSGAQVSSQYEEIADLVIGFGFDQVLYFGDLDAKGFEIVSSLRSNLLKRGVNTILEQNLYQLIIDSDLTTTEGGANNAGLFETDWMPEFIVSNLQRLVGINRRIPQEAFIRKIYGD